MHMNENRGRECGKNFQIFADHIATRLDDVTGINEQDVIRGKSAKQFEVQVLNRPGNDPYLLG